MFLTEYSNQRHDLAYRSIRQDYLDEFGLADKDECFFGLSDRYWSTAWYQMTALLYLDIIYNEVTSDTGYKYDTVDEYKTLFDYDNVREGYACKGVLLNELIAYYDLQNIIDNDWTDSDTLIATITVDDEYVSNFPTT